MPATLLNQCMGGAIPDTGVRTSNLFSHNHLQFH